MNLGVEDSYSIGIARSLASRVPVIWNDQNLQIVEIWKEFPSAIPLSQYTGMQSVVAAEGQTEMSRELLVTRVNESQSAMDSFWKEVFG